MTRALVIGGSRLIGPNLIEMLIQEGYQTVVFNRGTRQLRPEWSEVEQIVGDRNSEQDLKRLASLDFSVVFDTCCYEPQQAQMTADAFNGHIEHYLYVSSVAAYQEPAGSTLTEDSPLGEWKLWGDYGLNKAHTDRVFMETFHEAGFPVTVIRPTYVLGVGNHVEREAFFVSRLLHGIPIVVPGDGQALIHFTFADEVAAAMVKLAAIAKTAGQAFNCATDRSVTLVEFVDLCADLVNVEPKIVHVDVERFSISEAPYQAADLAPFANVPVLVDNHKLTTVTGLAFTPLRVRLSSIVNWYSQHSDAHPVRLRPKEREVLASVGYGS